MYKFKVAVKRSSALLGAVSLLVGVGASTIPALVPAAVSADALNPLTERSLTLSSSSPGWAYTDGSGNSTYAGPDTGTNGLKTGNTFSFRTSSAATIKAFTFQYCTTPAGECQGPGDDAPATYTGSAGNWTSNTARGSDTSSTSDLVIHEDGASNAEVSGANYASLSDNTTATGTGAGSGGTASEYGNVNQVPDGQDTVSPYSYNNPPNPNGFAGNFVVLYGSSATGYVNTYSGSWTMAASNQEEVGITDNGNGTGTGQATGKDNMITLTNSTGIPLNPGDYVKIMFFGTDKNYITNPGAGAFFVKINDYTATSYNSNPPNPITDEADITDGGVTVANVMNQSIEIQTKVLETMDFSVGVVDPDTLSPTELSTATAGSETAHGQCDPILTELSPSDNAINVLTLGNQNAENSLETDNTYITHSYVRLSSNSSGGATIYYAGNTLSNTEGNHVAAIGPTEAAPHTGTEQFGLALDNGSSGTYPVSYAYGAANGTTALESGADYGAATHGAALDSTATTGWVAYQAANSSSVHNPQLYPLVPTANYGGGTGGVNSVDSGGISTDFAFDPNSQTIPTAVASENSQVVNCITGKIRYIANIAATTPAGIYTTKINWIAAPQY